MTKVLTLLLLTIVTAGMFAEVYENQEFLREPSHNDWGIYLDFTLDITNDVYLQHSSEVKNTFPSSAGDILSVDNRDDLYWKNNNIIVGLTRTFLDKGNDGSWGYYGGIGSANTTIRLFDGGTIGIRGIVAEGGVSGDIMKFGSLKEKSLQLDCWGMGIVGDGEQSGLISEQYSMIMASVNGQLTYSMKTNTEDTSLSWVYIGGLITYSYRYLNMQFETPSAEAEASYYFNNQASNQFHLVVGAKLFWDQSRTFADILLTGALDGSYMIGCNIKQTF